MILEQSQINEILKGGNNTALNSLKEYQSVLRIYTENKTREELTEETGFKEFLTRFDLTDDKKRARLLESMVFPFKSVDITQSAGKELNKIWDAKNRFFNIDPNNEDLMSYGSKVYDFIKYHTQESFTNAPQNIVLLDYDIEKDEAYFKIIPIEHVLDYRCYENEIEWIFYTCSQSGLRILRDSKFIRYYDDKDNLIEEVELLNEFIPARFFVEEKINKSSDKRYSIFANSLNDLSDFETFGVCLTYTEFYGAFPVIQAPESQCSNEDCVNGKVPYLPKGANTEIMVTCPTCNGGKLIMPGTSVTIPAGMDSDQQSPADVFKFIDPDVKGLTYVKERQAERRDSIYFSSVGVTSIVTKEAVNQDQVKAGFESRKSILMGIKHQLEDLYKWMLKSYNSYNGGQEVEVSANFGTEFYLYSEEDLQNLMMQADKSGTPENEKENIYNQLVDTKYKGNQKKIEKAFILNEVNPFPFDSLNSLKEKQAWGVVSQRDLFIWSNFTNLIKRFERENGSVTNYVGNVNKIIDKLNSYYEDEQNGVLIDMHSLTGETENKTIEASDENAKAQANLRGSVGGVQGILDIQASVREGITSYDSALSTLEMIYGFTRDDAKKIIGKVNKINNNEDEQLRTSEE